MFDKKPQKTCNFNEQQVVANMEQIMSPIKESIYKLLWKGLNSSEILYDSIEFEEQILSLDVEAVDYEPPKKRASGAAKPVQINNEISARNIAIAY